MNRHFARKTPCQHGHTHASKREAARCAELHILLRAGKIDGLAVEPTFYFEIDGAPLLMGNGGKAKFRPDFTYIENGKVVAEDVKPKNGWMSRDVPLRFALFKHLHPEIELRVVT